MEYRENFAHRYNLKEALKDLLPTLYALYHHVDYRGDARFQELFLQTLWVLKKRNFYLHDQEALVEKKNFALKVFCEQLLEKPIVQCSLLEKEDFLGFLYYRGKVSLLALENILNLSSQEIFYHLSKKRRI